MNRYLIQVRDLRSGDSSHRVFRHIYCAVSLQHLFQQLHGLDQHEIEILASEEMTRTEIENYRLELQMEAEEASESNNRI